MAATVVYRVLWRRKIWICETAHRHGNPGVLVAFFGVKQRGAADGTESESELRALVPRANIFSCRALDFERRAKACQRGEDTSGSALASEAMAHANAFWLTSNLYAELAAAARGGSTVHRVLPHV